MGKKILDIFIAILITAVFVCCLPSCRNKSASEMKRTDIIVNGKKATFEKGFSYLDENGKTLAPMEFFHKYLGATVTRDKDKIVVSKDKTIIELHIGERQAMINGAALAMSGPVFIENGAVMAPVRVVSEALGAKVSWDEATRSVSVAASGAQTP